MKPIVIGIADKIEDIYGDMLASMSASDIIKKVNLLTANDKKMTNAVMLELFSAIKEKKK
tara:strand:+ start:832 stop:1011 length:180 start_codon:yes stop_codon:yes gene_type:complete